MAPLRLVSTLSMLSKYKLLPAAQPTLLRLLLPLLKLKLLLLLLLLL